MKTDHLFEKYYYSRPEFVDGTTQFHRLLATQIVPGSSILEIGAGPLNETTRFLATLGSVVGADVSSEVELNCALSKAYVFDGIRLPLPSGSYDVCVSNWVIEHVDDPSAHFREVGRVLKSGGTYCFRTPNRWHYFAVGSRMLPHSVHLRIANKLRGMAAENHDPYPTFYRANTPAQVQELGRQSGFTSIVMQTVEAEPSYGRLHPALFYPMFLYERLVNSHSAFSGFRASLLGALRKPDNSKSDSSRAGLTAFDWQADCRRFANG